MGQLEIILPLINISELPPQNKMLITWLKRCNDIAFFILDLTFRIGTRDEPKDVCTGECIFI